MSDEVVVWAQTVADARPGEALWYSNGQGGRHGHTQILTVEKRGRTLLTMSDGLTYRMDNGHDNRHGPTTPGPVSFVFSEETRLRRELLTATNEAARGMGIERRLSAEGLTDDEWIAVVETASALVAARTEVTDER